MLRLKSSAFALCLAISAGAHAQTSPAAPIWTLDGPAFITSGAEIRASANSIRPEPFAETTILFEEEKYALTADGRVTHTHHLLYRIETKAGVEDWNQASVQWDPWYQGQPSIKARVLEPGGHISELDLKTLTDVPANNEGDSTFSNARIYKGPLPSIAIGAIVEQQTVVADKAPFFSGGGVYRNFFSRRVPNLRSRLIVELPADSPFKAKLHGIPESVVSTAVEGALRRTMYDLNPSTGFSVPTIVDSDIDLATDQDRYPFVEFATGASWASVASSYQRLSEPQIQPLAITPLLPAALPAESMAALQAIVSSLHKAIRYTGIEFGESALQPQNPAEILKRHYGDCKDKAAFLVAMLRASGIPANLALLATGPGPDVNDMLPGMNQFDHAIVYIPASSRFAKPIWIDATAEFTRVGNLPYADQGRNALIIADHTSALTRTPDPRPEDSVLVETREFTLRPFGPAHVVESSSTSGHIDSDYRYRYGGTESKSTHDELEKYGKRQYLAKSLSRIDHTEGTDFSKPFQLSLVMDSATRGNTGLTDAVVAIPPAGPTGALPGWFSNDPDADAKPTPDQLADRRKAEAHRVSDYLVRPFLSEWRYRITLPQGFEPRTLPEDQTLHLGPATLTRHFEVVPGSIPVVVNAVMRFNSVQQRYTIDEALALRKGILELERKEFLLVVFDQVGAKLIAAGKIREGLASDRALIAAHPEEPIHHVQFAAALLGAGLGEQAQAEARKATQLDPGLAVAHLQLAIALERNSIGIQYGNGYDRAATIEAYRKARLLEPENTATRQNLAILFEHDAQGDRYAEGSDLPEAIREYRELKGVDNDAFKRIEDNLLYALLYNHQYKELLAELAALPSNPTRDAFGITCVAASQSSAAAIQRADRISGDAQQKASALRLAGLQLMRLNLYKQSSEMLSAASQGQQDSAQITRQVEIFRTLTHNPPDPFSASDARAPVQLMLSSMMVGKLAQAVPEFMDRHAFASDAEWKKNLEHNDVNIIQAVAQQAQLPASVMRDIIMGNAKLTSEGDDAKGYRVTMQTLGAGNQNLFVTRDEGKLRIVAESSDSAEAGNYALYLLAHKRDAEARNLLDWKRDAVHRGGGDDPLDGNLFARFWTVGDEPTPASVQIAALALTVQKPDSQTSLGAALAAHNKNPDNLDLTLLLASAYANRYDAAGARPYLDKLITRYPNSLTAITMLGHQYQQTGDFTAWRSLLDTRLAKRPADHDLLAQSASEAEAEHDFDRARTTLQKLVDTGKATAGDYNNLAWLGLFDDHLDTKTIQAAQQAVSLGKDADFGSIHTLACLYAQQGKITEARELLLKGMALSFQSEPNPEVWFGFASIFQQLGLDDAAIAAYKKIEKPEGPVFPPTATYTLAQARLAALHAN